MPVPTDISGLMLWLKADGTLWQDSARTTPATSDGDPVGAWDDASGNGDHYTQTNNDKRPALRTSVLNSLPVVRFDGTDDQLHGPDHLSGLTAGTIFCVVKIDNDPPAQDMFSGLWRFSSAADSVHYPYTDGNWYESFGSTVRKSTGNPTLALTDWRVIGVTSASGAWEAFIDGSSHYSTASNSVGFDSTPKFGVSGNEAYFLDGDIAELIIYDTSLSSGDRISIQNYLNAKYFGIVSGGNRRRRVLLCGSAA